MKRCLTKMRVLHFLLYLNEYLTIMLIYRNKVRYFSIYGTLRVRKYWRNEVAMLDRQKQLFFFIYILILGQEVTFSFSSLNNENLLLGLKFHNFLLREGYYYLQLFPLSPQQHLQNRWLLVFMLISGK